jgi:hypothetical protein
MMRIANFVTLGYFDKFRDAREKYRNARKRYLDMIQACLTGVIYEDEPLPVLGQQRYDATLREHGWDWPSRAQTMVGVKRLANARLLAEHVIQKQVPGDLMETGVWRGGVCIMLRAVLAVYEDRERRVWAADSFAGLPAPDSEKYPADTGEVFHEYRELCVSLDEVKDNFRKYDLLDDRVVFLKGWFKDTLPGADIGALALLRLDGDLYESTIVPLDLLYDRVSPGGFVIIDDYHVVEGCRRAVHDFLGRRNLAPELIEIDGVGVYWQKPAPPPPPHRFSFAKS